MRFRGFGLCRPRVLGFGGFGGLGIDGLGHSGLGFRGLGFRVKRISGFRDWMFG